MYAYFDCAAIGWQGDRAVIGNPFTINLDLQVLVVRVTRFVLSRAAQGQRRGHVVTHRAIQLDGVGQVVRTIF